MEILIIQRWHKPPVRELIQRGIKPWMVYESIVDLRTGEQEVSHDSSSLYGGTALKVTRRPAKRKGAERFYISGVPVMTGVRFPEPPRIVTLASNEKVARRIGPFETLRVSRESIEDQKNGQS